MARGRDDFPEDIIPLLLSYGVHHFQDLIFYRQINHTWKRICERSSQWLRIDLSFQPPRNCLLLYHNSHNSRVVPRNLNPELTNLLEEEEIVDDIEEAIGNNRTNKVKLEDSYTLSFLQPQTHFPQALKYVITPDTSKAVTPNEVQAWFIPLYLRYQQYWHFHITWKRYFLAMQAKLERIPWWCYAGLFLFPIVMLTLAMMSFEGSSLNEWWLGFVYLESVIVFYGIVFLVLAISEIIDSYFFCGTLPLNSTLRDMLKSSFWFILFFGLCSICLTIELIRWKVLSGGNSVVSDWSYIPLPLWVMAILTSFAASRPVSISEGSTWFYLFLVFFLPVGSSSITFAMDNRLNQVLAYIIYLWVTMPFIVTFTVAPILYSIISCMEWKYFYKNISFESWYLFCLTILPIFIRMMTIAISYVFILVFILSFADGYNYLHNYENGENIHLRLPNKALLVLNGAQICLWITGVDWKIQEIIYHDEIEKRA